MKNLILISLTLIITEVCNAQADTINYFGQTPPGGSAVIFAPEIISLPGRFNQNGSFSPDGQEFCFTVTNSDWTNCAMYYTQMVDDAWLTPQVADFVTGIIWDPVFTPDSSSIIYSYSGDLWMLQNLTDNWGNPVKLNSPVSSGYPEFSPSVSLDGTIYFFSRRSMNIYYAEQQDDQYTEVNRVKSPINDFDDREPFIAVDGSYLIFTSYSRTDQLGEGDLYISYQRNNRWTNPKNLGPEINSTDAEFSPNITPDGNYLLFTRRDNSGSDIYWVSTLFIDSLKKTNYKPYVLNSIPEQLAFSDEEYRYIVPDTIFFDDDGNHTLTFSAKQSNGNDLPDWLIFDPATKTFSGFPYQNGNYTISVVATDTHDESAIVNFILEAVIEVGINLKRNENIKVYPNPASQILQITGIKVQRSELSYKLTDLNGRLIRQDRLCSESIDISGLPQGVYLLSLTSSEGVFSEKIVIK